MITTTHPAISKRHASVKLWHGTSTLTRASTLFSITAMTSHIVVVADVTN